MGRGKLSMKLIAKEKDRITTYKKRKRGLKKKAEEFATLCGVPTCMIIYGPKIENRPSEIDTWPEEPDAFMQVVNLYREKSAFSVRGVKTQNMHDFFADRQRKLDEKVAKLRKANLEAKFPSGALDDQRLNCHSVDELKALLARIDSSLEVARRRIVMLKNIQNGSQSWVLAAGCSNNGDYQSCLSPNCFQKSMEQQDDIKLRQQQQQLLPISSVKPQLPVYYNNLDPQAVQMLPCDLNPIENPMTMMMNNGGELTQFGSTVGSGSMAYPQLQHPMYFDPVAAMLDNVMLNSNPRAMFYYGTSPTMQPLQSLQPYEHCTVLPSVSCQTQMQKGSQFNHDRNHEFHHEINQFGIRSQRGNF